MLIDKGVDVNAINDHGFTPLYNAVKNNHLVLTKSLLERITGQNNIDCNNALLIAAEKGFDSMVELLLQFEVNVNCAGMAGNTPLHLAAQCGRYYVTKLLLEKGAEVDAKNNVKQSPIHLAALKGCLPVVQALVEAGASISVVCDCQFTPLHYAAASGAPDVVTFIVEKGASIDAKAKLSSRFHCCKCKGSNIPEIPARKDFTSLHIASKRGDEKIVELLLEKGADVQSKTSQIIFEIICDDRTNHTLDNNVHLNTALHLAAACGSLPVTKLLLAKGADIDAKNNVKQSPMHIAAYKGCLPVVEVLFEAGASINSVCNSGFTPLHYATASGVPKVVTFILEKGADVHEKTKLDTNVHIFTHHAVSNIPEIPVSNDFTSIHIASKLGHKEIVELLLEAGADINSKTDYNITSTIYSHVINRANGGSTALDLAASCGSLSVTKLLLAKGAKVDEKNNVEQSAIHIAAYKGSLPVVQTLFEAGASINAVCNCQFTPLHYAVASGASEVVTFLLDQGVGIEERAEFVFNAILGLSFSYILPIPLNKHDLTPLHIACKRDDEKTVNLLLERGANVNAKTEKNKVGLCSGNTALHFASECGSWRVTELLLAKGAVVNANNDYNYTALHLAAYKGFNKIAELLLKYKANVNCSNKDGDTPLHLAAKCSIYLAFKYDLSKAKYDDSDDFNYTALHFAAHKGSNKIVELLLLNKVNVNCANKDGNTPLHWAAKCGSCYDTKLFLAKGTKVDANNDFDHIAAHNVCNKIVELLLQSEVNVNSANKDGNTPLHLAAESGSCHVTKLLLEKTEVSAKNPMIQSPIHIAAHKGFLPVVEALVEAGASINTVCSSQFTPLHYAVEGGAPEVIDFLLEKGANQDNRDWYSN